LVVAFALNCARMMAAASHGQRLFPHLPTCAVLVRGFLSYSGSMMYVSGNPCARNKLAQRQHPHSDVDNPARFAVDRYEPEAIFGSDRVK
jgi:hypothetical protein